MGTKYQTRTFSHSPVTDGCRRSVNGPPQPLQLICVQQFLNYNYNNQGKVIGYGHLSGQCFYISLRLERREMGVLKERKWAEPKKAMPLFNTTLAFYLTTHIHKILCIKRSHPLHHLVNQHPQPLIIHDPIMPLVQNNFQRQVIRHSAENMSPPILNHLHQPKVDNLDVSLLMEDQIFGSRIAVGHLVFVHVHNHHQHTHAK